MKTAKKFVLGLLVLSAGILFGGCSEDSGWTAGMSGFPLNSAAPAGTEEPPQ